MSIRPFFSLLWAFLALACLHATPNANAQVPRIIYDADMSSDHDDVGAIATLHALADLGECQILACMVSSTNGGTPLCMDVINTYYGRPNIPIGVRPDITVGIGGYAGTLATEFPHGPETSSQDFPRAAPLYRQILASQPDNSVTIVTNGYLTNLKALLQSGPDQYSPLNGTDLVRLKVKLLSCMGGSYPSGNEFNFRSSGDDSAYVVVNNWPTRAMYSGFSIGQVLVTGGRLLQTPVTNPIRRVWQLKGGAAHASWDQTAVYQAVRASEGVWDAQTVGHNNTDVAGGNWWSTETDPTGNQDQGYLLEKVRYPIQMAIDTLMMAPPNNGSPSLPGQPTHVRATAVGGNRVDLQWTDNSYNETGFTIERKINGAFAQIATVGANVSSYSNTGLTSTANAAYRVKAYNGVGSSAYANVTVYSPWTEINFDNTGITPALYTYYQSDNLRWGRGGDFRPDHVALNNDSIHGQDLTVNVLVGAMGSQGTTYVYFFYQDANNWYRLNVLGTASKFEKRVGGVITQVGAAGTGVDISSGSPLRAWQLEVTPAGNLKFISDGTTILNVTQALSLSNGKVGLGGAARSLIWNSFSFSTTSSGSGSAPSAPTGLSATAGNTQVSLSWTASAGATSYNVYRGTTAGGQSAPPVATGITATSYTNTGLTNGTTYYYKVKAVNASGESSYSNEASAAPTAGGSVPSAPTGLAAVAGDTQVSLTWSASSGATTYNVYRGLTAGGQSATPIATGISGTNYTNTGLTNGTNYYYKVKAVNASGSSAYSNEASGTPASGGSPPAAPTGLSGIPGNAQVSLSWTSSPGAVSYNVYRGTTAGGQSATAIATGITITSYTNTGLTNGTTYFYTVKAVNTSGTSGNSNEASATPSAGGGTGLFTNSSFETPAVGSYSYNPAGSGWTFTNNAGIQRNGSAYGGAAAPDGVQTALLQSMGGTLGTMSQAVNFAAGSYTISFQAARRPGSVQPIRVSVDGSTVGTYTPASNSFALITTASFSVTAGTHTITFAATDNIGDKTSFIDLLSINGGGGGTAPAAPTGLNAAGGNAQVSLSWNSVSGATSYSVYRGTSAGGQSATPIATGITGTTYTNTGLTNGTAYYYKVRAVNSSGTSGDSNEASATPSTGGTSGVFANASFETPAVGSYSYNPAGSSWTFTNNAGIQRNGSAYSGTSAVAPDGVQTALLQSSGGTLGTMSQSVNFTGGTYTIRFQAARRSGNIQPIRVSVDGTTIGTYTPASNSFAQITTASFSVAAGNHTVTFAATDSVGDKTSFIDLVSIGL